MSEIKNVIFDLGGVLLNIDYNKTTAAFKQLGFTDFENMYSMLKGNNVFDNLETGHITEAEFYSYMLEAAEHKVTEAQITAAWNAMLLDFRISSLDFLQKLTDKHRLFLLSNTNNIHKRAFDAILHAQTGLSSLDGFFEKAYYSQKVGIRKPNAGIFEFVLKDAGIQAEETLFIDDLHPNISTAEKLGFKTHLLKPGELVEELVVFG